MRGIILAIGEENFELLRKDGSYYVDKTKFLVELLQDKFKVNLITRPRRFGKTLTMSMLKNFLDIRKDSREIFEGLEISKHEELCGEWMNQWPVLFLSLKDIANHNFRDSYDQLAFNISSLCIEHAYLGESDKVDEGDRACFERLKYRTATEAEIRNSFYTLSRMMYMHYGRQVILLIDEYDVPLAKSSEYGYYQEMLNVIRSVMSTAFKTNEYLKFAVITGCLRIARESIFTGTNHFVANSIYEGGYMDVFGFTEQEVRKMLSDAGFESHIDDMRRWYDGYRFGKSDIYCPWDVVNHIAALKRNPDKRPGNYWKDTSHNDIIKRFVGRRDMDVSKKFEILLAGGSIKVLPSEDLTYNFEKATEREFWSILYLTGYLTSADRDPEAVADGELSLRIPNEEVRIIFKDTIVEWFQSTMLDLNREALFSSVWNEDVEQLESEMTRLLRKTISYYDYNEDFYHAFLAGIFAGRGYQVESNREHGEGRSDVVVKDNEAGCAAIFEVKHTKKQEELEQACQDALKQIDDRFYGEDIREDYDTVICYGIAFYKKRCRILLKNA